MKPPIHTTDPANATQAMSPNLEAMTPPAPGVPPASEPSSPPDPLILYGESFASRLLLGTSRYPSPLVLHRAVGRSQPAMLTASLRRQTGGSSAEASRSFWQLLQAMAVPVLPNTVWWRWAARPSCPGRRPSVPAKGP